MEIKQVLQQYAAEINHTLEEIMIPDDGCISETLLDSMRYSLFSGGKRLRPILTLLTAELTGGDRKNALLAGSAIEMIHTYSLIHDDLPSMDNDDYRRGRLTNHRVYGSGIAILAGDALLTYAFNILSRLELSPDRVIKIIELISRSAGYNGMAGGQVLDLEGEQDELDLATLEKIHLAKTGALFQSSILAGAYCGEPTSEKIRALNSFSYELGLTFQIVDDILDITGDSAKLGKSVGQDERLKKSTYPRLLGLEGAEKEAAAAANNAREALAPFGERAALLVELVNYILVRQS